MTGRSRSRGHDNGPGRGPRVVFLGHDASRTGAPVGLLHLLRWLRRETALDAELVLLAGGPLLGAYRDALPTSVVSVGGVRSRILGIVDRLGGRLARAGVGVRPRVAELTHIRKAAAACRGADLIYANSAETASVLHELRLRPRTLLHIHEMSYGLRHIANRTPVRRAITEDEHLQRTMRLADSVLVPSEPTRDQLLAIAPEVQDRCQVIPEMIDVKSVRAQVAHAGTKGEIRAALGIPRHALVVVGCGYFGWRKGIDLFVQVAARVPPAIGDQPVYFVWIGVPPDPTRGTVAWLHRRQFDFDVRSQGLQERVILVPPTPTAAPYIAVGDVFLLPSREDPFPLVAIEAAALGTPVICFDSSGTASMIGRDAGAVVRHLDVVEMSTAVERFLEDPPARASAGLVAARRADDLDVSKIAPRVIDAMTALLREPSSTILRAGNSASIAR